jgi:hypothetical protein
LYLKKPWERPEFLETAMDFQVARCRDDAEGRKEFLMGVECGWIPRAGDQGSRERGGGELGDCGVGVFWME